MGRISVRAGFETRRPTRQMAQVHHGTSAGGLPSVSGFDIIRRNPRQGISRAALVGVHGMVQNADVQYLAKVAQHVCVMNTGPSDRVDSL